MSASSKRRGALEALRDRLARITVANGFATDAGERLFLGEEPVLGSADPQSAIAVVVGDDSSTMRPPVTESRVVVSIQALVPAGVEAPLFAIEDVIADIKRAVELPDRSLEGYLLPVGLERATTRALPREPGAEYVGAAVDYTLVFEERWGKP